MNVAEKEHRRRMCTSKRRFYCELDANESILRNYEAGAPQLRIYPCPYCGHLHLTSDVDEEAK